MILPVCGCLIVCDSRGELRWLWTSISIESRLAGRSSTTGRSGLWTAAAAAFASVRFILALCDLSALFGRSGWDHRALAESVRCRRGGGGFGAGERDAGVGRCRPDRSALAERGAGVGLAKGMSDALVECLCLGGPPPPRSSTESVAVLRPRPDLSPTAAGLLRWVALGSLEMDAPPPLAGEKDGVGGSKTGDNGKGSSRCRMARA